ncbi:MAG: ComEC/Rec2 family competence protein [Oscillospiraceae bacterium]|nr:ComEC/Rec2 family competence protein [Oscillospiraceae bacterium]
MFRNRFLSVYAVAFAAGVAGVLWAYAVWGAISFVRCAAVCFFACTALLLPGLLLRKKRPALLRSALLIVLGLLCGGGRMLLASTGEAYEPYVGRQDTVVGSVVESASYENGRERVIRIRQSHTSIPKGTLVLLYARTPLPVRVGEQVTVSLTGVRLPDASQRAEGVSLVADGEILSVGSGKTWGSGVLSALRQACERLYAPYGEEGVAQALLLRERSALTSATTGAYRNAGLSHLLAISGLHLVIYMAILHRIVGRMALPRWMSVPLLLLALLGFSYMTSFSPSVLRAAVMLGILTVAEFLNHRVDRLTTLFVALLFLLLWDPYALLSVSLQLSFLACLGLLLLQTHISELCYRIRRKHYYGRGSRRYRLLASAAGSVLTSCSVLLFTFPVLVFSFGQVAYLSPLMNLLVLPFFAPLLSLLLLSVLAYFLLPPLAPVLAFLPGQALRLLEAFLGLLYRANIGSVDADPRRMVLPVLLACCAVLSALLSKKHTFRFYWSFSAAFAVALTVGLVLG